VPILVKIDQENVPVRVPAERHIHYTATLTDSCKLIL